MPRSDNPRLRHLDADQPQEKDGGSQWDAAGSRARAGRHGADAAPSPEPDYDVHPRNISGEDSSHTLYTPRSSWSPPTAPTHVQTRRATLSSTGEAARAIRVDPSFAFGSSADRAPHAGQRHADRRARHAAAVDSVLGGTDQSCGCPTCAPAAALTPDATWSTISALLGPAHVRVPGQDQ
jgi:hypothetical protein